MTHERVMEPVRRDPEDLDSSPARDTERNPHVSPADILPHLQLCVEILSVLHGTPASPQHTG